MKAVKKTKSSASFGIESLEDRRLMAVTWGAWPTFLGLDKVVQQYPWLNGGNFNVGIVDKGIDYWHSALGGNRSTNTKAPRIVNVHDYRDGDNDPFPSESEITDPTSAHGTGVSGILISPGYDLGGKHYQGILQTSKLYNLRTNRFDSQNTIQQALQWILDNHVAQHITAVNLTDFIGTGSPTPVYDAQVHALWDAGVFIITPVANDWQGNPAASPPTPAHQAIGYPAKSPWIFGSGGILLDGTINPKTQRGAGLDLLGPSDKVVLPYYTPSTDSDVVVAGGTGNSWGTPHILGTAVLIQQIDPTIKPAEIMEILQDSGQFVSDPDSAISGFPGYMRLDIYAAIQRAYNVRDDIYDQGKGGDDDFAHAGTISLNSSNAGSVGNLKLLIHDHDYFKFTVNGPDDFKIKVNYSGSSAFPGAELLDADGNLVQTIGSGGISGHLAAGDYYVHLFNPTESLVGTYSITINTDAPPPPPSNNNGFAGENGTFNDIKFDQNDNLHLVWYDANTETLKYAKRNLSKIWGTTQVIDSVHGVGNFVSMDLDSAGRPGVAYYDAMNADLKYAHYNGSSWDIQTIDATFTTGYYPSLKYDTGDHPYIAYFYKTGGDLRLATNLGSGWTINTIDSKGDVGRYADLVANPISGRWSIAYENTGAGAFKFAKQGKGGGWSSEVVDTNGAGGGFISLAYDDDGLPSFSYYDAKNGDLRFARYNGSLWSKTTVAAKGNVGLYTTLFYDSGNPVIYYFNKTMNVLSDARWNGGEWEYETVVTDGGRHNRVALNSDDFETFSWYDDDTGDVHVGDFL
jgi:hypothetical protein